MALVGAAPEVAEAPKVELSEQKKKALAEYERLVSTEDMNEDSDDESYKEEDESEDIEEEAAEEGAAAEEDDEEEDSMDAESDSELEEADEEVDMEEVADVIKDAEIPLSYSKDGLFNPTQVLRDGKQVFSELRATTIEKGEFDSDEEDEEYEESDSESIISVDGEGAEATAEAEEEAGEEDEAEEEEEDEEPEFDEPVTTEELKSIVDESGATKAPLKSSKILRHGKEIAVDENVEDLSVKIKEMLSEQ